MIIEGTFLVSRGERFATGKFDNHLIRLHVVSLDTHLMDYREIWGSFMNMLAKNCQNCFHSTVYGSRVMFPTLPETLHTTPWCAEGNDCTCEMVAEM